MRAPFPPSRRSSCLPLPCCPRLLPTSHPLPLGRSSSARPPVCPPLFHFTPVRTASVDSPARWYLLTATRLDTQTRCTPRTADAQAGRRTRTRTQPLALTHAHKRKRKRTRRGGRQRETDSERIRCPAGFPPHPLFSSHRRTDRQTAVAAATKAARINQSAQQPRAFPSLPLPLRYASPPLPLDLPRAR